MEEESLRSRRNPSGVRWRKLSPARRSSWLILDPIVHRSRRLHGVVEGDATTSATSHDCVGRQIRASLRVAAAPAVSRLHLHLPDREWVGEIPLVEPMEEPSVIAAHCNSILFKVVVPFKDSEWSDPLLFPVDYFVYSAAASSFSPPSLTRLPACFEGVAAHPDKDKYFHPYRRQRQRVMLDDELGLLCHGENGEFTVADLSPHSHREVELCILHHHHAPPGVDTPSWKVKRLQITPHMRMTGLNLVKFRTDVVLPISGRFLCWVDYYQGMLLVDFLQQPTDDPDDDHKLSFIPLPSEALRSRRPYIDEGDPDPFRCICVTSAGIIKLVCITKSRVDSDSHLDFTIETWTLDIGRGKWQKDFGATMKHGEFFNLLYGAGQNLPKVMPSFPLVSMVDPDVISFLLKDDDDIFWMIEVNMWHKKLQSSAVYIKEEEEEAEGDQGYFSKKVCRIFFDGHYFIPSQFSAYLSEDAITSWELSDMMQKKVKRSMAKQKRKQRMAKQKSGVEEPSKLFSVLKLKM
ncbi:unnamed protein product [Urochloa decumbens]|uniref:DUF1618 domain-containing protein n=1 Tax=Urochloa decumbens TaxID=240449 RepID=A0ABC9H6U5_9POAL